MYRLSSFSLIFSTASTGINYTSSIDKSVNHYFWTKSDKVQRAFSFKKTIHRKEGTLYDDNEISSP